MILKSIKSNNFVKNALTHVYVKFKRDNETAHSYSNDVTNKASLEVNISM